MRFVVEDVIDVLQRCCAFELYARLCLAFREMMACGPLERENRDGDYMERLVCPAMCAILNEGSLLRMFTRFMDDIHHLIQDHARG